VGSVCLLRRGHFGGPKLLDSGSESNVRPGRGSFGSPSVPYEWCLHVAEGAFWRPKAGNLKLVMLVSFLSVQKATLTLMAPPVCEALQY